MASLRTLWSIEDASFRALVEPALIRHGRRSGGGGDRAPCQNGERKPILACMHEPRTVSEAIRRPEVAVWPWLRQVMRGGGIYGWSPLEGTACRSAQHLVEGIRDPRVGEHLGRILEIAAVESHRRIAWRSLEPIELLGHQIDELAISYQLCPHGPTWTRLVITTELSARRLTPLVRDHLLGAIELVLTVPQSAAIRRLAESDPSGPATIRPGETHQAVTLEGA